MTSRLIQNKESDRLLRVLFDSGASHTLIHSSALPLNTHLFSLPHEEQCQTVAGTFTTSKTVRLRDIRLPEFDKNKRIHGVIARVFDAPCNYDVILGRDLLMDLGLVINFKTKIVKWMDHEIPMRDRQFLKDPNHFLANAIDDLDLELESDDPLESYILDAKYERMTARQVVESQKHLSAVEQQSLETVLDKYPILFDGKLGHYPHKQFHLDLEPHSQPVHAKPYAVPLAQESAFKKELNHLLEIGVLRRCGPTEWASPTFIIPKKDGRVRWISDLRELNKCLKRKVYPLPLIHDIVNKRSGYKYFTKIDLTMFYYTLELDEESKNLCTIVTPYGKFQYCRMAMGLKPAPDIAQATIEEILRDIDVDVYIDDVGIFSNSWENHLKVLDRVLQRLQDNGCKVNPLKCEWGVKETDFLGHWLTPEGVKPWKKKIDAVLKMESPKNITQLRSFLGAVTYYRNMWPRRSHVLAPLTELTGKSIFEWTPSCEKAFREMKSILAADVLMAYPNINLPFEVYTDASDYQMGAVIMQNGRPVAYWSRKLDAAQKNYSTMEKEMLAVVYCFQEFRTLLYGARITVFTDNKNLTFRTLNTQRVLRWRMFLEDFHPTFRYCPGKDNVLADCFSRLPRMEKPTEGKRTHKGKLVAFDKLDVPKFTDEVLHVEDALVAPPTESEVKATMPCRFACCRNDDDPLHDPEMFECFLNHPTIETMPNPITILNIQQHQFEDLELNNLRNNPALAWKYPVKYIQNRPIICYKVEEDDPEHLWKIAIPQSLVAPLIRWYHLVLGHCGSTRLYSTISERFHAKRLHRLCATYRCNDCQKNKQLGQGYGKLPQRHAALLPWNEVAVDLIGPWKVPVGNDNHIEFNALTCIDPVTNLVEIIRIENKSAAHVSEQFENLWLSRYPRPNRCIHDNGGEFIGWEFQQKLQQHGIKDVPITSRNPQANAICERMHQTVANVLRTTLMLNPPQNLQAANQIVDNALATTVYATRASVSRALGTSPGNLVFRRDMFVDLPLQADLVLIRDRRQQLIDENLRRQNAKRREFEYQVGQEVLIKSVQPNKLEPRAHGPYTIQRVYQNGTIDVARNAQVVERINIRRVIPFRRN